VAFCSVKEDLSMFRHVWLAMMLTVGLTGIGCSWAPPASAGKSPLSPFRPGIQTSALEVTFVRHDYELPALNEDLWSQVDETSIAPGARQALAQNGLRAGVIAGALPLVLEEAMTADDHLTGPSVASTPEGPTAASLESDSVVRRRMLHALPGQRAELLASGIYNRLPLLVRDGDETQGECYYNAQCVVAAKATPLGDHRVRLQIVPELQHGEPRQQIRGDDGIFRIDSARPKVALDKLTIDLVLSPGQAVLLGAHPELPGSVGHYFFTEPRSGRLEQKLMLIRFTGTRFDNLLVTDGAEAKSGSDLNQ
jgi:hypothetical protein